jgi:triacylglycerol lipase
MIDDVVLAQAACLDAYNPAADWDAKWEIEGVIAFLRIIDGEYVLVFEGSHNSEDFVRDAETLPVYIEGLGWVHSGFYIGVPALLDAVLVRIGRSVRLYITGHSLGGGRTYQATVKLATEGLTAVAAVGFAPPRPGFADFGEKLVTLSTAVRGYHNHFDVIPDVPPLPFCHKIILAEIAVPCDPNDKDLLFRYHHGPLYFQGVSQLIGGTA